MFFSESKTLIVVYKDELLANQLKKMVETQNDAISIVPWEEKVWLAQKKTGTIDSKVLFIGDIKGMDKLIPLLDVQYEEYGITCGWSGNYAVISADQKQLQEKEKYEDFLAKVSALSVPAVIKANYYIDFKEKQDNFFKNAVSFMSKTAKKVKNAFTDSAEVKRQMLFYGVIEFYDNHLKQFV